MEKRICLFSFIVSFLLVCVNAWAAPFAYITNYGSYDVSVIDTSTNAVIGSPIPVGGAPYGVAVNPAGTRVYVANVGSSDVSVIDTSTNAVIGSPIPVGQGPWGVAVNPAGTRVYVTNGDSNNVSVINTSTNAVIGSPIPVGQYPHGAAVNPAGTRVYVTNRYGNNVSVINTSTNAVIGSPIPVGQYPYGVAVNPASTRVYVTNVDSNNISVIDTSTNTVMGSSIPVGKGPTGVAVNPAGTRVYVTNGDSNNVSVIDTTTNTVIGAPIPVGSNPKTFGQFIGQFIGLVISPGEGTVGTEFTITGSGFGAKKSKVLLGTAALKILEWTDESIQCQLTKALPPAPYDVTIQPQARGSSPIVIASGFAVEAPEIDSVNPTSGSTGDEITVNGLFFGTKKGKVTLGGKTCRVLSWTMDPITGESEIQFVVPRGLSTGTKELKVTNGVGVDTTDFTVE